jgi:hypothetical protein
MRKLHEVLAFYVFRVQPHFGLLWERLHFQNFLCLVFAACIVLYVQYFKQNMQIAGRCISWVGLPSFVEN